MYMICSGRRCVGAIHGSFENNLSLQKSGCCAGAVVWCKMALDFECGATAGALLLFVVHCV